MQYMARDVNSMLLHVIFSKVCVTHFLFHRFSAYCYFVEWEMFMFVNEWGATRDIPVRGNTKTLTYRTPFAPSSWILPHTTAPPPPNEHTHCFRPANGFYDVPLTRQYMLITTTLMIYLRFKILRGTTHYSRILSCKCDCTALNTNYFNNVFVAVFSEHQWKAGVGKRWEKRLRQGSPDRK